MLFPINRRTQYRESQYPPVPSPPEGFQSEIEKILGMLFSVTASQNVAFQLANGSLFLFE